MSAELALEQELLVDGVLADQEIFSERTISTVSNIGAAAVDPELGFAWLEITGKCQLECGHCYAESGPQETHGTMTEEQWIESIDQLAGVGTNQVQFIGGEPTLHPSLPKLVDHALNKGMGVEVYTNLAHVTPSMWGTFSQEGVMLATSYYSPDAGEHEAITNGRGSHRRTRDNIQEAVQRGIPIRAGIIGVREGQQIDGAVQELAELGVSPDNIGVDYVRQVGRGARHQEAGTEQLCGNCADGVLAIKPNGDVQPCVFSRRDEFTVGNVQKMTISGILASDRFAVVRERLSADFASREIENCKPCRPGCSPNCAPSSGCAPVSYAPELSASVTISSDTEFGQVFQIGSAARQLATS